MKLVLIFFAGILISCASCHSHKTENIPAPVLKKPSLVIGNPLDCGIEGMQIFPVGTNYKPMVYERKSESSDEVRKYSTNVGFTSNTTNFNDRMAKEEYINHNENEFDIRNILFFDLQTGKSYPLHTDTMHILSFALHKEFKKPLIFYRVVKTDLNKDSIFNSNDPVMLFVSDLNGENLVQCTPEGEQFIDYFYYEKTQTILVKTVIDADKDQVFSKTDETNFREVKLDAPALGREIFSQSMKDSLRIN